MVFHGKLQKPTCFGIISNKPPEHVQTAPLRCDEDSCSQDCDKFNRTLFQSHKPTLSDRLHGNLTAPDKVFDTNDWVG